MKEKLCEKGIYCRLTPSLDRIVKQIAAQKKCSEPEALRQLATNGSRPREIIYIPSSACIVAEAFGSVGPKQDQANQSSDNRSDIRKRLTQLFTKALREA